VATCFEVIAALPLVKLKMEIAAGRPLTRVDLSRLAILAFLHDCGKLHPGFQAKGGWPGEIWPRQDWHGHVREGAAIFRGAANGQIARHLCLDSLVAWGVDEHLLFAVLAHHGRPFRMNETASKRWREVPELQYDPVSASAEIGALLPRWFEPAFMDEGLPLPNAPDFQHLLCGLVSLADWLGSTRSLFHFMPKLDPGYIVRARDQARRAVVDIGLDVRHWRDVVAQSFADFSTLLPGKQPRASQQLVGNWSLDDSLIILEAETGSGKTEAALWRFARLFQVGQVDSLYFALPTRAAAKQIHGRVNQAMQNVFGADAPEAVLAVPGYIPKSGETKGKALPNFEVRWDDDDGLGESKRLARWAAESANRYLAATIAVGTVDQAMLAGLQVKHAHLRAAALSRSLLVIDEVHASDRYMTEVQSHLLDIHLRRGGHAMLMSATLGSSARTRWLKGRRAQLPTFDEAVATPYPAVWGTVDEVPSGISDQGRQKTVDVMLVSSWKGADAAELAIEAAQAGARVLVVRNTVKAAVETFAAVRRACGNALLWQVGAGPALHHSRFAREDRELLDREVERALSPKVRSSVGVIVIGTQTLEQSLDIDSDFLISDLCPADVLLQRIGRLHRHGLSRPTEFKKPQCVVLAPEQGLSRLVTPAFDNGLGMFRDGGGVYRNLHACELTRRLILDHPEWSIPSMNRFLVESATHEERIAALNEEMGQEWEAYWNHVYGKEIAEVAAATYVAMPVDTPFADVQFASDEQKIRTRLGAEGAVICFVEPVMGPFGQRISSVTLPDHWSRGTDTVDPVEPVVHDGSLNIVLGEKLFHYDREGLSRG
jgi:CRISPR-associated endonuclease/helicase Cas3